MDFSCRQMAKRESPRHAKVLVVVKNAHLLSSYTYCKLVSLSCFLAKEKDLRVEKSIYAIYSKMFHVLLAVLAQRSMLFV